MITLLTHIDKYKINILLVDKIPFCKTYAKDLKKIYDFLNLRVELLQLGKMDIQRSICSTISSVRNACSWLCGLSSFWS
jgi:hypothetical protein